MREIKFRAWDKAYNKMVLPEKSDKYWVNFLGGIKEYDTWADEVILMQYIGLKDKNGKEIYEGDIVQSISDKEHQFIFSDGKPHQVVFENGSFPKHLPNYFLIRS